MDFPSGFQAFFADGKDFLKGVRFARPSLFWLSLVPVVLSLLSWFAAWRHRRRVSALGKPATVATLQTEPNPRRFWGIVAMLFAWLCLTVGLAGPRWGIGDNQGVAVGRDLVLVLDFSRSMWADDVTGPKPVPRWEAAVAAAKDLIATLRKKGGHRVGIVLFAARPKLIVPLTTDYDHLNMRLEELDARAPPAEIRPTDDAISGTRIGAALAAATEAHDPRFPGYQDIVLLTDADDPADDREWALGTNVARKMGIPVHVIGIGDPLRESPLLRTNGELLEATSADGIPTPVQTKLHETTAKAIADDAKGTYYPARQDPISLGNWFRVHIEPNPTKDVEDDRLPQRQDRAAGFLIASVAFFALAWWKRA